MTQDKDHVAGGSQVARSGSEVEARPTSPAEKHTPGPWAVGGIDRDGRIPVYGKDGVYRIASVHDFNRFQENGANLALITAAPDLLAGARHLIAYEEAMDADDHIAAMQHYAEAMDTLRAAIAKATGEPQ